MDKIAQEDADEFLCPPNAAEHDIRHIQGTFPCGIHLGELAVPFHGGQQVIQIVNGLQHPVPVLLHRQDLILKYIDAID